MIVANPPMIFSASILDTVSSGMVSAHTSIVLLSVVEHDIITGQDATTILPFWPFHSQHQLYTSST